MSTDHGTNGQMGRREFLQSIGGGLVFLSLTPIGCSNSDGEGQDMICDGLRIVSEESVLHTHTLCVPPADLSSPPASGRTYQSSDFQESGGSGYNDSGGDPHRHAVSLSAQELTRIASGETVTVNSMEAEGHIHAFSIRM
jgi:hypothetical protein